MDYMKLSLCFLITLTTIVMTFCAPSRKGDIIHFQESSEMDTDIRPGNGHRNRNHRGRGKGHIQVGEFEQGIPGVYPIRGPPQLPFVLPTTVQPGQQLPTTNTEKPIVSSTPNLIYITAKSTTNGNQYSNNPFLKNIQKSTTSVPVFTGGITNQLSSSAKPSTTTPAYQNPRRTDLLYGSNLLEEEESNREGKPTESDGIEFDDRGLFDTAPHCQSGKILVNNRCRLQV